MKQSLMTMIEQLRNYKDALLKINNIYDFYEQIQQSNNQDDVLNRLYSWIKK